MGNCMNKKKMYIYNIIIQSFFLQRIKYDYILNKFWFAKFYFGGYLHKNFKFLNIFVYISSTYDLSNTILVLLQP